MFVHNPQSALVVALKNARDPRILQVLFMIFLPDGR
jgi:hypothetical protein